MCGDEDVGKTEETPPNRELTREFVENGRLRPDGNGERTLEAIFRVLTSRRRRYALYELQESNVTDIESLAVRVAVRETGVTPDEVDATGVGRVKAQLAHSDVPLLGDAALVEYDSRSGAIRYADPPQILESILHLCAEVETATDERLD